MKKQIDEDTVNTFLELKKAFTLAMVRSGQAIRELRTETNQDFKNRARVVFLKGKMTDCIIEAGNLMEKYEDYTRRDKATERLLTGEKLQDTAKEVAKLQSEIIFLKKGKANQAGITEDMIQRARSYPFTDLIEIKRNTAKCFLHEDKRPSMHYYPEGNRAYCFSCNKGFDTIDFIMQKDGLSFPDAVRRLQ